MNTFNFSGLNLSPRKSVCIMGVINVSPESFYKGSIPINGSALLTKANQMINDGATILDIGAMSTAPYLKTIISEDEEARRLETAVNALRKKINGLISIDTFRAKPAARGLQAGANIINDVKGLLGDRDMPDVARKATGVILMANECNMDKKATDPTAGVLECLQKSKRVALKAGLKISRIAYDPGIGFFRNERIPWWQWDVRIVREMNQLSELEGPILAGVSRKSFIGKILSQEKPEDRLEGSLAATATALQNGATIIRTHDVEETAELIRSLGLRLATAG